MNIELSLDERIELALAVKSRLRQQKDLLEWLSAESENKPDFEASIQQLESVLKKLSFKS